MKTLRTEAEVRRLTGDELKAFGDAQVYEVIDNTTQEGVYYIIVDQDEQTLTLVSIDMDGNPATADLMILGSRIDEEPVDDTSDYLTWKGDLEGKLKKLLGSHAAIITQDLQQVAKEAARNTSLLGSDDDDVVRAMRFDFDPSLSAVDQQPSGGVDGEDPAGGDGGGQLPSLPPSIDPERDTEIDIDGTDGETPVGAAEPDSEDEPEDPATPSRAK